MRVLVLEASTSAAKAMVYDTAAGPMRLESIPYPPKVSDVATHDALGELALLMKAGREAAQGQKVDVVALATTWHSLLLADGALRPKSRMYMWTYTGAAGLTAQVRKDKALSKRLYHKTGCVANALYPAYQLMYLRQQGKVGSGDKVCSQSDFIYHYLTGEWCVTQSAMSGASYLNISELRYEEEILERAGVRHSQMPPLVDYRHTGKLATRAARELGIDAGIPVVTGNPDGALNQIGAGALQPGIMTISVGTSAALRMAADGPTMPEEPSTWCYYAPGKWLSGAATNGAANCVDWFIKGVMSGKMGYAELEAAMPQDKDFPVFLPFPYGERCPGWNDGRHAAFSRIKGTHTAGHLYRAVLEGVLFNIYQCYLILTEVGGVPHTISVSGGILHSAFWTQMLADVLQREIACPDMVQASMTGAAAMGMLALGELEDLSDFRVERGRAVLPNADMAAFYAERFQKYQTEYDAQV